jgi:lycopene cyclase domain-containing protein
MPGSYTIGAIAVPVAVAVLELAVLRTGLFRTARYWVTLALVLVLQIPVDGALTHGPTPVVAYREAATSGIRLVWDIPIEDFGFGFALVTLVLLLWLRRPERPVH